MMTDSGPFNKTIVRAIILNRLKSGRLIIITLIFAAINPLTVCSQYQYSGANRRDSTASYFHSNNVNNKRFGRAATMLMSAEVIPWVFDRYLVNADYSRISFAAIKTNLRPSSWSWDYDDFQTNQIGHPFHGSIFFNAYRSNGYTFWQSVPASFAGSYIWETFAEKQLPSPNDLINTGFGGIMLGEVTHRMANRLINNNSRGAKRQLTEVFAFLINPSNGLNRLLDGKWGKVNYTSTARDSTKITAELDLGFRKFNVNEKNPFFDGHFGGYGRFRISYGSPAESMKDPFSNVSVTVEAGQDDSSKLNLIGVYGNLAGWKIYSQSNTYLAIVSANYDYIRNSAFFYSAEGVKMNLSSEFVSSKHLKISGALGMGAIFLAAIPDAYTFRSRIYDYGPGLSYYGSLKLNVSDKFFYNVNYRGGWMSTINGNPSDYFLHALTNEISLAVTKQLSLRSEYGYFNLHGNYRHFDQVNKTYPYLRFAVGYNLDL